MKLYLSVPRQSARSAPETTTRTRQTRAYIARLPLLDAGESVRQILSGVHGMNRTPVRTAQRLKLLDMYRAPLRVIRGQVESRLSRGAAPLSAANLSMAEAFRDCCIEMGYGYKIVILEVARSRRRRQLDELRLSMGRTLFYLEQAAYACAMYRQLPPEGLWLEAHTIYWYARQLGIHEDGIRDPVTRTRSETSISVSYRRALLFGLSDPYHQSVPLMGRLLEFLRRHAQDAAITRFAKPPTERCQFVIDPMSDRPARPFVKVMDDPPPRDGLLLDTLNLTRRAHDQLQRLTSAEEYDVELDDEFQDELGRKLLEEVVYAWGVTPRRREEREAAGHTTVALAIGVAAVSRCLNGGKPVELSSAAQPDHANLGPLPRYPAHGRQVESTPVECRVVDRSESGIRLSIAYDAAGAGTVTVGEVVALRVDDGAWRTGTIRWVHCPGERIQIGVALLPPAVRPVAVRPFSNDNASNANEAPFSDALAIQRAGGESGIQLIAPAGVYRQQRNLFIDDGNALQMARGTRLIERHPGSGSEWFECQPLVP